MTNEQQKRLEADWAKIAGSPVWVEKINDIIYAYGSEPAVRRIFCEYNQIPGQPVRHRVGFSKNLKMWYFAFETLQG